MTCPRCRELLAIGLDLCVRARAMDARDRRDASLAASSDPEGWVESGAFERFIARSNITRPEAPIAAPGPSVHLWEQDQYATDLAAWEAAARRHLQEGCATAPAKATSRSTNSIGHVPV